MSAKSPGCVVVIDPARHNPELPGYNRLARTSPLPLSYHLPAMHGMRSLAEEDMQHARGLIILGSASSVNDREPWQETLETWLMPHLERGLPTFGICYGQQMLAYMFGGTVGYVYPDQTKHIGLRQVTVDATACWPAATGQLVVSHNEMVTQLPGTLRTIARSAAIACDGIAHRSLPIWGFQAHPEATASFFADTPAYTGDLRGSLGFGYELLAGFLAFAASR